MRMSILATVALLAIPTLASAHGGVPFSTPNVIHGCRNQNGVLRQITSGGCGGDVVVHWSITGPAGPIGPGGPQGPTGATGAPGTNGVDGTSVALPDPPCFDNDNRYVNCLNGTVTDTVTGLIWLRRADCLPFADYAAANAAAAALANGLCFLTDGSSPGDWRLPTKDEWSATIARAVALGCTNLGPGTPPLLTNNAGTACLSVGPTSFVLPSVLTSLIYYSSTTDETNPIDAFGVTLAEEDGGGGVGVGLKSFDLRVWPVRGGPR